MKRKSFLQIPRATEGIHLEEAYRHRLIINELDRMFVSWGYLPVETPAFDFFDTYRPLLQGKDLEKVYRLIDREGDLLMLRSDITLFLAKQIGIALREEDLPVRTFYSGVVLRHQNEEDISSNEFFQVGAELIGKPGIEGDLEILMLVLKTLETLEVSAVFHIGSRALFRAVAEQYSPQEQQNLSCAIASRDRHGMYDVLSSHRDDKTAGRLSDLFLFIGTLDEYLSLAGRPEIEGLTEHEKEKIRYIATLSSILKETGSSASLRIDLSEIGSQPYYTGIVFQGYKENIDSAFLSGGRYDELLSLFGLPAASVGFSFFLRKIAPYIGHSERFSLVDDLDRAEGETFIERLKDADTKRRKGKRVAL